jgi:hypothetical protein
MNITDGVINARWNGAEADFATDDTDALQAALDTIAAGEAACLYLPIGRYRTTRPLILRGSMTAPTMIRGEAGGAAGGSSIIFDGPAGSSCVLEVAGGIGVEIERVYFDCRARAVYGLFLRDDQPRAIMSDVLLRSLTIVNPLPGDSPDLAPGAKSAAISIGVEPDGTQLLSQCDAIKLIGLTLISSNDEHAANYGVVTGTANVKNFFIQHPWMAGFQTGIYIPNGGGTCTVTGGTSLGCTHSDFMLGSGILAVTGWESEGSHRLLSTPGFHAAYASASFDRCAWYGAPEDDIAIFFGGNLTICGCDLQTGFSPERFPRVALIEPQSGSATSVVSEQNFFRNAQRDSHIFCNWNASAPLAKPDGCPAWLKSWGDLGGAGGALIPLPILNGPTAQTSLPVERIEAQATITRGKSSVVVEHGLGGRPHLEDVTSCPVIDGPTRVWLAGVTEKTLTYHADRSAPTSGITFTFSASRRP